MATKAARKPRPAPEAHQVAALPVRRAGDGGIEVLLVTSRETRRWIIPKGWPVAGMKDHKAAAREALEEAGLAGRIGKVPLGSYETWKLLDSALVPLWMDVYLLHVERELATWREKVQRERRWVRPSEAVRLVEEPGLRALLEQAVDAGSTLLEHER
jgi:8-oxo-dGTP pyrophosphatase MutT (NUDIX family)